MADRFSKDINNALNLLEASFDESCEISRARMFKDGIYLLNDLLENHPAHEEEIKKHKYSFAVRLLSSLTANQTDPGYATWFEYVLLFCIDLKNEIKHLHETDPAYFEIFLKLLNKHSHEISSELKENIAVFLNKITGKYY